MKTIWRFDEMVNGTITVKVPRGAYPLPHVAKSDRYPDVLNCITTWWVIPDSDAPLVDQSLVVAGTGNRLPDAIGDYLGTVPIGHLVWHVFRAWVEEPF